MNKLLCACALLAPIVGCTGIAGDGTDQFGSGGTSVSVSGAGGANPGGDNAGGSSGNGSFAGTSSAGTGDASSGGMNGGGGSIGGTSSGGACTTDVLPSELQTTLKNQCSTCHGATPLAGLPSLMTYANLTAPSKSDPTKTNAVLALARMQNTTTPMPPAPGARASATDISNLQAFISAGYPKQSCATGAGGSGGGGASGASGGGSGGSGGAMLDDPLNALATCTSMTSWTGGNRGSASMNPGLACVSCHSMGGDGPRFSIAGTVYPTGHEPDRCNSKVGSAGATIVIIGADGKQLTLTPNAVGNFSSTTSVKTPFQAKVTYQGRERLMLTPQSNGDCNSCHTQNGAMMAPGRITIP